MYLLFLIFSIPLLKSKFPLDCFPLAWRISFITTYCADLLGMHSFRFYMYANDFILTLILWVDGSVDSCVISLPYSCCPTMFWLSLFLISQGSFLLFTSIINALLFFLKMLLRFFSFMLLWNNLIMMCLLLFLLGVICFISFVLWVCWSCKFVVLIKFGDYLAIIFKINLLFFIEG